MNRRLWMVVAVVALVAVVIGSSLASASPGGRERRRVVIETLEVNKQDVLFDVPPSGDSSEDGESIRADLVDPDTMESLGFTQALCAIVVLEPFGLECYGTIHLADGVITVAGSLVEDEDPLWAVRGGTGTYSRVRGTLTLSPAPNGNLFHTLILFLR